MSKNSVHDVMVKKKDVVLIIQNMIREIQMNDYNDDSGIKELYEAIKRIDVLKCVEE